jgi:Spy/CpxP family protein refolding chaperone
VSVFTPKERTMTRVPYYAITLVAAAAVAAAGWSASAEGPKKVEPSPGQPKYGFRLAESGIPALPGFNMLRMENVQKELGLVPEQIQKLKDLGTKYYEDMKADQDVWKNWQKMTPDERTAKSAEMREKYKKRTEELRKSIEKVLLPNQLSALREVNLRAAGPGALANPRTLDALGVSDEQKQKLQQIRQEMFEQYQEVQKKSFEKSMSVLTPEQRERLKEQVQKSGY